MKFDTQQLWDAIQGQLITYGLKIIFAIGLLIIGSVIIRKLVKTFASLLKKRGIEETLLPTLSSIFKVLLLTVLMIAVVRLVGIDTTGLVAVLGAAGLAIGLALQGSLSNFAGGILILTFKPFKNGDVIHLNGETGEVQAVTIMTTVLKTPDNKVIYMPNGAVAGAAITNYSIEKTRRLDQVYGISYSDDLKKAKNILKELISKEDRILKDPEPAVLVSELADSAVNITIRVWCKTQDYWDIHFEMIEKVKLTFDQEGINFPFPQMDVYLSKQDSITSQEN